MTVPRKNRFSSQFPFNFLKLDNDNKLILSDETQIDVNITNTAIDTNATIVGQTTDVNTNITNLELDVNVTNTNLDVTIQEPLQVSVVDNSPTERSAFGEQIVMSNFPVAGWKHTYNVNADLVKSVVTGSGTVTGSAGMAVLSTTAATNSSASINTYRDLRYSPGQGALVRFTAIFTTGVANSEQYIGIGAIEDGLFFGYNGTSFGILHRNNSVDTWIPQASWNVDTRVGLDPTKGNVYSIVYQWLGFGMLSFNIEDSATGRFVNVHNIAYANLNTVTSFQNPTLSVYAYVKNTSNNTNVVLKTPSAMAFIQGFADINELYPLDLHRAFSASKSFASTLEQPIISVLGATTFQSLTNRVRSRLAIQSAAVDATKPVIIRLYKNATVVGGAYTSWNANTSTLSANTTIASFSGGNLVNSFQLAKSEGRSIHMDNFDIKIGPTENFLYTSQCSGAVYDVNLSCTLIEKF